MESAHGGVMANVPGTPTTAANYISCVAADMQSAPNYVNSFPAIGQPDFVGGVEMVAHKSTISMKNITASTPQTVSLYLLKSSNATSLTSNGAASGIYGASMPSGLVGPAKTANSDLLVGKWKLNGQESLEVNLNFACGATSSTTTDCQFWLEPTPIASLSPPDAPVTTTFIAPTCTNQPHVCMYQRTMLIFRLTVDEDRGAVIAHLATTAGRGCGYTDRYIRPPMAMSVNGGRAF